MLNIISPILYGSNGTTDHNALENLQGGSADQYYHLNADAYNNLYDQNQPVRTDSKTQFADLKVNKSLKVGTSVADGGVGAIFGDAGVLHFGQTTARTSGLDPNKFQQTIFYISGNTNYQSIDQHVLLHDSVNGTYDFHAYFVDGVINSAYTITADVQLNCVSYDGIANYACSYTKRFLYKPRSSIYIGSVYGIVDDGLPYTAYSTTDGLLIDQISAGNILFKFNDINRAVLEDIKNYTFYVNAKISVLQFVIPGRV